MAPLLAAVQVEEPVGVEVADVVVVVLALMVVVVVLTVVVALVVVVVVVVVVPPPLPLPETAGASCPMMDPEVSRVYCQSMTPAFHP
jgi:hypothetical protein